MDRRTWPHPDGCPGKSPEEFRGRRHASGPWQAPVSPQGFPGPSAFCRAPSLAGVARAASSAGSAAVCTVLRSVHSEKRALHLGLVRDGRMSLRGCGQLPCRSYATCAPLAPLRASLGCTQPDSALPSVVPVTASSQHGPVGTRCGAQVTPVGLPQTPARLARPPTRCAGELGVSPASEGAGCAGASADQLVKHLMLILAQVTSSRFIGL